MCFDATLKSNCLCIKDFEDTWGKLSSTRPRIGNYDICPEGMEMLPLRVPSPLWYLPWGYGDVTSMIFVLMSQKELNIRQKRWIKLIKDYYCTIEYHSGKVNVVANVFNRKNKATMNNPLIWEERSLIEC